MKKVLTELQDLLIKELEKITEKKDITPTELDHVKNAMCAIKDIEEVMAVADTEVMEDPAQFTIKMPEE